MEKIKSFLFLGILLTLTPLLIAANSVTINTFYDFSNDSFIDSTVYKTDSVVLRVKTSVETECYYSKEIYPSTPFQGEYGLTHEIYLENIEEGFHEYYIRCGESSNPIMKINFATSTPIYATIKISENAPLKSGRYKINLITSKTSLNTPLLEYSFDDLVYKTIPLRGSGKNWEGNLIIPENAGESVCSFRFKSKDITGEEGTKIIGDNLFLVDTIKPSTISIISATGYKGKIKLNWFSEEKIDNYNVYRSEYSPVDYTDFYELSSKDYFYDEDVEKGKTYYYKIAAVDEAGNIGDLSKEVYATALLSNTSENTGLNIKLIGKVDNFIIEIDSLIKNIEDIKELLKLKDNKEKQIFESIKLNKELESAILELNSLKRDVENYKLQDLSEDELNKKISSSSIKLSIIKKKIPEDITIIEEVEFYREIKKEDIDRIFLQYSNYDDRGYGKEITYTQKLIEDPKTKIKCNAYSVDIIYIDGTKKKITFVEEELSIKEEYEKEVNYILIVPKEIAERASDIKVINLEYETIKEGPIILFKPDVKKVTYYFFKEIPLNSIKEITLSPIKIPSLEEGQSKITGNSILEYTSKGYFGIIVLIAFALILGVYFLRIRNGSSIKPLLITMENLKKVKSLLKEGREQEAKELYSKIKEDYKTLSKKEKELVVEKINEMNFGGIR